MKRIILEISAVLALISTMFMPLLTACAGSEEFRYASGATWGTVYHIKYLSDRDLSDSIVRVMHDVDMSLSPFQKGSLVSRLNAGERVKADSMLADVFRLSQQVCSISGGAFDPTVAPLVNLWGFGYREGEAERPAQAKIDTALLTVGILECSISSDGVISGKHPHTEYNFSAVAKGYGVDMIAAMLRRNGCEDYMVEVGGEIALRGNGPSGDGWVIQVDAPVNESPERGVSHQAFATLRLTDVCLATSGNYRNRRSTSEGEVWHTISPVTGMPVLTEVLSATIIAPTTALADAIATASMAMPLAEAKAMIQAQMSVEGLLVVGEDDSLRAVKVPEDSRFFSLEEIGR